MFFFVMIFVFMFVFNLVIVVFIFFVGDMVVDNFEVIGVIVLFMNYLM